MLHAVEEHQPNPHTTIMQTHAAITYVLISAEQKDVHLLCYHIVVAIWALCFKD